MKALRFHRRGGPEQLCVEEVPAPTPGPGQVRVAVIAAALNRLDCWVRSGLPIRMEMPHIGGADFAGIVDLVGPGCHRWTPGDAVVGYPRIARPHPGPGRLPYVLLGEEINGAFCEAVVLPEENLVAKPAELTFVEAAAIPVAFVTAWTMLALRAELRSGETLLVQGAGSGVGTAAVQIGRHLGARVIACTSAAKREGVLALGADAVIDDRTERIDRRVRELTGLEGAHVVLEHVGAATWATSIASAAYGGRIVTCGATTGRRAETDIQALFGRELRIEGVTLGPISALESVLARAARDELRPVVDRMWPLERGRDAHEALEQGGVLGKIVLAVDEGRAQTA